MLINLFLVEISTFQIATNRIFASDIAAMKSLFIQSILASKLQTLAGNQAV